MKKLFALMIIITGFAMQALAVNIVTTVLQVSGSVTVSDDVDYVITDATPFIGEGKVNITNTEHAVVIISSVKPSKVISSWLKNHVFINGVQAVDNSNCQVKMYASGAIIMPYAKGFKPLTVYSQPNFEGVAVNDFGLENTNGFMNTLSEEKLNNKIRSFKLKRGYMVTFSTRKEGRGYSRCFIADKEDLEIAELPNILDQSISSYRVFQWYNAKKAGIASDTRTEAISTLNASWCYDWATGVNHLPDAECVPNHIYEDWPSPSACGSVTYSCHMKTNNEPANTSDDHPQSVQTVLNNWENLMRTGLRLCSPSTHDGGWNWHNEFMNAIDERGWRCDIVDFHGYWNSGVWNSLDWRIDTYAHGRPVWFSEWVWGASWNRDGFWGATSNPDDCSEANQQICYDGTTPILERLNSNSRVERYAYWNSEAAGTHIYHDGKLTKLGQYYAAMNEGLGYNPKNEFIPKNPKQYDPSDLRAEYDKASHKVTLYWHERNGEYNKEMIVECMEAASTGWQKIKTMELQEEESDYQITIDGKIGFKYRIKVVDANGTLRYTNITQTVSDAVEAGDEFTVASETMYMGGNMLINGDFEFGLIDWTNGKDEPLAQPYFEAVPIGGINGSAYLQAYGNSDDKTSEQSVRKVIELEKNACYYAQLGARNGADKNQKIATSTSVNFELNTRASASATTEWSKQGSAFKVGEDNILLIQLRSLAAKAQFDDIVVAKLFATPEEAMADALYWVKKRAEAFKTYNTEYPQLNEELDNLIASCSDPLLIEKNIKESLAAVKTIKAIPALAADAELAIHIKVDGYEEISTLLDNLNAATAASDINAAYAALYEKTQSAIVYVLNTTALKSGPFEAKETAMETTQRVTKLDHGFYSFEMKAATQHFCVADQHGFIVSRDDSLSTPIISYGVFDIPTFADAEKWENLHTPYIYITEKEALTIGFTGSKWWRANDFQLRQIQAFKDSVDVSGWGTVCLPYAISVPENTSFYEIAGITADQSKIAIRKVEVTEAGTPYIYYTTGTEVVFFESGEKAKSAKTNSNGLRGQFSNSTYQYPLNALVLKNGVWEKVSERYKIKDFSGYIQKIENLTVLDSWAGEYLLTEGLAGIEDIFIEGNTVGTVYTIDGTIATRNSQGVLIKRGKKAIVR